MTFDLMEGGNCNFSSNLADILKVDTTHRFTSQMPLNIITYFHVSHDCRATEYEHRTIEQVIDDNMYVRGFLCLVCFKEM